MATSGGQPGNQNAVKNRPWRNAITRAIEAWPDKPLSLSINRGIDEAAFAFVGQMMDTKDAAFFREFGDRLDGKPAQAIVGDADADPVQMVHKVTLESL